MTTPEKIARVRTIFGDFAKEQVGIPLTRYALIALRQIVIEALQEPDAPQAQPAPEFDK